MWKGCPQTCCFALGELSPISGAVNPGRKSRLISTLEWQVQLAHLHANEPNHSWVRRLHGWISAILEGAAVSQGSFAVETWPLSLSSSFCLGPILQPWFILLYWSQLLFSTVDWPYAVAWHIKLRKYPQRFQEGVKRECKHSRGRVEPRHTLFCWIVWWDFPHEKCDSYKPVFEGLGTRDYIFSRFGQW